MEIEWRNFVKSAAFISQDGKTFKIPKGKTLSHMSGEYKKRFGRAMSIPALLLANHVAKPESMRADREYVIPAAVKTVAPQVENPAHSSHGNASHGAFSPGFSKFLEAVLAAGRARGIAVPTDGAHTYQKAR